LVHLKSNSTGETISRHELVPEAKTRLKSVASKLWDTRIGLVYRACDNQLNNTQFDNDDSPHGRSKASVASLTTEELDGGDPEPSIPINYQSRLGKIVIRRRNERRHS
jgi:hypothetical protein